MHYNHYFIVQNIAIVRIIGSLAPEYVVLKENELCEKQNTIDDENECKDAALSIRLGDNGKIYIYTKRAEGFPRGCYINFGNLWFNSHPVGKRSKYSTPICRKGKFVYLQTRFKR